MDELAQNIEKIAYTKETLSNFMAWLSYELEIEFNSEDGEDDDEDNLVFEILTSVLTQYSSLVKDTEDFNTITTINLYNNLIRAGTRISLRRRIHACFANAVKQCIPQELGPQEQLRQLRQSRQSSGEQEAGEGDIPQELGPQEEGRMLAEHADLKGSPSFDKHVADVRHKAGEGDSAHSRRELQEKTKRSYELSQQYFEDRQKRGQGGKSDPYLLEDPEKYVLKDTPFSFEEEELDDDRIPDFEEVAEMYKKPKEEPKEEPKAGGGTDNYTTLRF